MQRSKTNPRNRRLRGPYAFAAQFLNANDPRFKDIATCGRTFAEHGIKGMELPLWHPDFPFERAVASKSFCEDYQAKMTGVGCPIMTVTNHLDMQNVGATPPLEPIFGCLCPKGMQGNWQAQREWSKRRVMGSILIAQHFGFRAVGGWAGHHGASHLYYPWLPINPSLLHAARTDHAKAWMPILNFAEDAGVDVLWEFHPVHGVVNGLDFQRYLPYVDNHRRVKAMVDLSHLRLQGIPPEKMPEYIQWLFKQNRLGEIMHIKEAVYEPDCLAGTLDFGPFPEKRARFRGMGDGDIGYVEVFDALDETGLEIACDLEWEDCGDGKGNTKGKAQALREGAAYIGALLEGTELPPKTEPEPHKDGDFEAFAKADPGELKNQIARVTGLPVEAVELLAA